MLSVQQTISLAIVESIYVIYIMNFFKTRYSLAHPLTYFNSEFLYHPIGHSDRPICNICKLGNYGAYLIALFILLRMVFIIQYKNKNIISTVKMLSLMVLIIVFTLSLMNFNAVVYLLPYFFIELCFLKTL